jgi:peptide deformylase
MALRSIRELGDEILLKRSKEVKKISKRDLYLIEDMLDTMYESGGAGLAAPQVGVLKRIVVIQGGLELIEASEEEQTREEQAVEDVLEEETLEEPIILINPEIISEDGKQTGDEGCLSVPGKWGVVSRPNKVTVKAFDINMKEFQLEGEGLLARAICHEIDHLDGKLYVDLVEGELRDGEDREEEA